MTIEIITEARYCLTSSVKANGVAAMIHEIDGDIWVLGHIANFDDQGNRHYYAMVFCLERNQFAMTQAKIIAERNDFQQDQGNAQI